MGNEKTNPNVVWKIIDLAKWFIVSVVLVVVALEVNSGITNREIDIKELTFFDKYVNIVIANNNVGAKRELALFFKIVSPTENLRKRWENYYNVANQEFNEYLKKVDSLDEENTKVINSNIKSEEKEKILESITKEKLRINKQLNKEIIVTPDIIESIQQSNIKQNYNTANLENSIEKLISEGKSISVLNPTDIKTYLSFQSWRTKSISLLKQIDNNLGTNYKNDFANSTSLNQSEYHLINEKINNGLRILESIIL